MNLDSGWSNFSDTFPQVLTVLIYLQYFGDKFTIFLSNKNNKIINLDNQNSRLIIINGTVISDTPDCDDLVNEVFESVLTTLMAPDDGFEVVPVKEDLHLFH